MNAHPIEGPERTFLDGLLHYLSVLYRHHRLILISTGVVVVAATAFCILSVKLPPDVSFLPNVYTAQASILVQENSQNDIATTLLEGLGLSRGGAGSNVQSNGDLIVDILGSRVVIDPIVDEFHMINRYKLTKNVRGRSREIVRSKSAFVYERNTGIVRISFQDIDPGFSAAVVNRMVRLLEQWFARNETLAVERQRSELETKIGQVKNEMDSLRNQQKRLQEKYGFLSATDLGQSQTALLATLRAQLLLKEIDIKNYSGISRIDDPRLQQLKEERQNLIDLIDNTEKGGAGTTNAAGGPTSLADAAQRFAQLQFQLDLQQRIYDALLPQLEAASLSSAPIFQVITLADVPDIKSGPQRSRIIIIAALIACFGSMFFALLLNVIREVRNDPSKRGYFRASRTSLVREGVGREADKCANR